MVQRCKKMEEMTIDYQEGFRDGVKAVMRECMMRPAADWPEVISNLLNKETQVLEDMKKAGY